MKMSGVVRLQGELVVHMATSTCLRTQAEARRVGYSVGIVSVAETVPTTTPERLGGISKSHRESLEGLVAKTIGQRSIDLLAKFNGKKSDTARALLAEGYSVSEVSKAIPAAYSQVLAISKKLKSTDPAPDPAADWGPAANTPTRTSLKPVKSKVLEDLRKGKPFKMPTANPRIGKLRLPGMPSDTDVGECINCGFDLVIRGDKTGFMLIHVGASAEDYLSTIQFCNAVPKVLRA